MMRTLSPPTWREILAGPLPVDGPYRARRSRLGYVWSVVDTRTGAVRATAPTEQEAEDRADALNRAEASWTS